MSNKFFYVAYDKDDFVIACADNLCTIATFLGYVPQHLTNNIVFVGYDEVGCYIRCYVVGEDKNKIRIFGYRNTFLDNV